MSYVQRVADRASEFDPARAVLTVLAAPFYLVGLLVGIVWVALAWIWAAVLTGAGDVRGRGRS